MKSGGIVFGLFFLVSGLAAAASTASLEDGRKAAFEKTPSCDLAVATNDGYIASSLEPLFHGDGRVQVTSLNDPSKPFILTADGKVVDVKFNDQMIYVLSEKRLEAWDLQTKEKKFSYATSSQTPTSWRQMASGFVISKTQALVAHGAFGVTKLDLTNGNVEDVLPMPEDGAAMDLSMTDSGSAVVAIDSQNDNEFQGLFVIDPETLSVQRRIKIDNAFPLAVRVLEGNRLMVVYLNAIWKFDAKQALSSKKAQPKRRVLQFPGIELVDIVGKVAFDSKNLYGCFRIRETSGSAQTVQKPLAFDLTELQLQ